MSFLLDTHALLWWLAGVEMSADATTTISSGVEPVVVSSASIWEAAIKAAMGKLELPEPLARAVTEEGFEPLAVTIDHAERLARLPLHHCDPFDRMLVVQAQFEGLTIITRDAAFDAYDVPVLAC